MTPERIQAVFDPGGARTIKMCTKIRINTHTTVTNIIFKILRKWINMRIKAEDNVYYEGNIKGKEGKDNERNNAWKRRNNKTNIKGRRNERKSVAIIIFRLTSGSNGF